MMLGIHHEALIVLVRNALLVFTLYISTNLLHIHIKRKKITFEDIKNVALNAFLSAIMCICVLALLQSIGFA